MLPITYQIHKLDIYDKFGFVWDKTPKDLDIK
jgi:hypothetical protein